MEEEFPFQYYGKKRIQIIYTCRTCGYQKPLYQPRPSPEELKILESPEKDNQEDLELLKGFEVKRKTGGDHRMRCPRCGMGTKWNRYIPPEEQEL